MFSFLRIAIVAAAFSAGSVASSAHAECSADGPVDSLRTLIGDLKAVWSPWCGPGSYGQSGWMQRDAALPKTTDATSDFARVYADVKAKRAVLPADAKEPVYLVVSGLFTKHYPGYMKDNFARLAERGLDFKDVPVDTAGSVEDNAKTVRDWILDASKDGRKVVLITHSKGGVDVTAALSMYPELKPHVRALVAMQTPFGGTPMASDVNSCRFTNWMMNGFINNVLGGDTRSISDLGYAQRRKFLAAHPYVGDVPTVSLATARRSYVSTVGMSEWYMLSRYGIANDGMVPMLDAEIPGSQVVRLFDMDHAQSTFRHMPASPTHVPGDVTEALIAIALDASR